MEGAEPRTSPRDSLKGAAPIVVVVSVAGDATTKRVLQPVGGTEQAIQNRVEIRLRRAALPVFSYEEAVSAKMTDAGVLRVNIIAVCEGSDVCGLFFDVQFLQRAILDRIAAPPGLFATWTSSNGVMAGRNRLSDAWLTLDDILDMFANQWLSANPKT